MHIIVCGDQHIYESTCFFVWFDFMTSISTRIHVRALIIKLAGAFLKLNFFNRNFLCLVLQSTGYFINYNFLVVSIFLLYFLHFSIFSNYFNLLLKCN